MDMLTTDMSLLNFKKNKISDVITKKIVKESR